MGNATKVLMEIAVRDAYNDGLGENTNKATEVDEMVAAISAGDYDTLKGTIITREVPCQCCGRKFQSSSKVSGRSSGAKYCAACKGPQNAKKRRDVRKAGSFERYMDYVSSIVPYNRIDNISHVSEEELARIAEARKVFAMSVRDIAAELEKRYKKKEGREKILHQKLG